MKCRNELCDGIIEPIQVNSYREHLIAHEDKCSQCGYQCCINSNAKLKFEKSVDLYNEIIDEDLDEWMENADSRKDRCEEAFSQAVLQKTMPGYEIIHVDNGSRNNQYDFLSIKNNHTIAVEVTQAVDQGAIETSFYLKNHNNNFGYKHSRYNWNMGVNKSAKLSRDTLRVLKKYLDEIESYHIDNHGLTEIDYADYQYNQITAVIELRKQGVICFNGRLCVAGGGSLEIQGPFETSSYNIDYALQVINQHSCMADNIKKLELAKVHERHIFIPITAYQSGAAYYLESMPNSQTISLKYAAEKIGVPYFMPDVVDVVWLSTFMNFTPMKRLGYRLAKVTRMASDIKIENVSNGIVQYRG